MVLAHRAVKTSGALDARATVTPGTHLRLAFQIRHCLPTVNSEEISKGPLLQVYQADLPTASSKVIHLFTVIPSGPFQMLEYKGRPQVHTDSATGVSLDLLHTTQQIQIGCTQTDRQRRICSSLTFWIVITLKLRIRLRR
jgi:hypothetical protein